MFRYFIILNFDNFYWNIIWACNLQLLGEETICDISSPLAGTIMNNSKLLSERKYSVDLLENFIFA